MGLQQSKDELLYKEVSCGTTEGIKKLHSEGAGLEWIDKEGNTPLILASMNPLLFDVAKTLIELDANVNAYRPGLHAGTPLHHAAKSGLEPMVKLLLSHGANALVINDDSQTALDVARAKGHSNVVRAIENHICLFSGWLQDVCGPGFFELLRQLFSRKVWVVILPRGTPKLTLPFKLELAVYSGLQDATPRSIIALWKANMDEPNFNHPNPIVVISISNKSLIRLASVNESEKQQLQQFCNACKGIPQVMHPAFSFNNQVSNIAPSAQITENPNLGQAITASLSDSAVRPVPNTYPPSSSTNPTTQNSENGKEKCENYDAGTSSTTVDYHPHTNTDTYSHIVPTAPINTVTPSLIPSAPPMPDMMDDDGPIHYLSIDSSSTPINLSETRPGDENEKKNNDSLTCVICLDAPVEGACIPCGHMAGCMICLNEIKGKNWGCPVCRSKIDQVVQLFAV